MMEYDALLQSKITKLAEEYRAGSRDAGASLLNTYSPLMSRYISLAISGSFDPSDEIMCSYMRIVSKDPFKAAETIRDRFKTMNTDEVVAETHYCLLQAAMASNEISPQFKTTFMKKVVWFVCGEPVTLFGEEELEDLELNDLWVSGISASNGFEELSEGERYVLMLAYQEEMNDGELVNQLQSQNIIISIEDVAIIKQTAKDHLKYILECRGYFKR